MIADMVRGDIFAPPSGRSRRHVCFAVNDRGTNDDGFAGFVADRFWPELADAGPTALGSVQSRVHGEFTLHALCCHGVGPGGWDKAPGLIQECLNKLPLHDGAEVACVLMGAGPVGQKDGADAFANLGAMARCRLRVVVYTL